MSKVFLLFGFKDFKAWKIIWVLALMPLLLELNTQKEMECSGVFHITFYDSFLCIGKQKALYNPEPKDVSIVMNKIPRTTLKNMIMLGFLYSLAFLPL